MTSTFGSVTLQKARITNISYKSPFSVDITTAGKTTTQGTTQYAAVVSVSCQSTSRTDAENLLAVLGSKLTLTVGSHSFTNMKIAGGVEITPNRAGTLFEYSFVCQQETV